MTIYKIGQVPESEYARIGGKARGLDKLKRKGYNIPDGFVIENADDGIDVPEIFRAFDLLGAESVSVRSSASDEDGGEYSNAGQYETSLDVKRDGLKDAVDKCVASLNAERVKVYSRRFLKGETAKMNVVVQRMVESRRAGVTFTADPSNADNLLIESVEGQGENLVSGAVSSCRYSIPKKGGAQYAEGNLSGEALSEIFAQAKKITRDFGGEFDLEWAIDGDGVLYWLQMRPITATDACEEDEFNPDVSLENHLLTSRNIGEMMPGAVTPLSVSTSVLAIDYGIRNMMYEIGAIKSVEARPDYFTALSYKNHLFIDMTALHSMSKRVAMASPAQMNLSIMGEYREDYPEVEGKNAFILTKLKNSVRFAKYLFSSEKAKKKLVALNDALVFEKSGDAREVYDEICRNLHVMNEALCCHYVCSSFSGAMNSALYIMLSKKFDDKTKYQAFISTILSDIDGIESADILARLNQLARAVKKENPDAADLDEKQLLDYVTDERHAEINALYKAFLEKHGHRSIKEAELRSKAWKNDPSALMKNLHAVLISDGERKENKKPFNMEEALSNVKGSHGSIKWIGEHARKAVVDREFSKSNIIRIIDKFKDRYILLASLLKRGDYLFDEDDIYFLTNDEIGRLLDGDSGLKRKIAKRRNAYRSAEHISFDDVCIGAPVPLDERPAGSLTSLSGISVCKGKVYGKARIVRNARDAERIEKNEIMVAAYTDIGWSPYYSVIGALVTEVGSALSHGAVVAREYCLPTVVNVKNATRQIRDGDLLYVDADQGRVDIISEEQFYLRRTNS